MAAFTFARRRLFTPTRFLWGQLYCCCIAPCRVGKIFACQAYYSRVSLRCRILRLHSWTHTHHCAECNNNNKVIPDPDCRRVVRAIVVLPFLHSKSATRTALPHLLPCAQHIARRCATTATSGSTCSSPQHHATARLLQPPALPNDKRSGDASARQRCAMKPATCCLYSP